MAKRTIKRDTTLIKVELWLCDETAFELFTMSVVTPVAKIATCYVNRIVHGDRAISIYASL